MRKLLLAVVVFLAVPGLARAAYNPGGFTAPAPSTITYPTLPYVTPEMYGAVGDGATDDHAALNAATAAACAGKLILFLDKSYFIGATTWNMTSSAGCNSGLTIQGSGMTKSIITYHAGTNNTGIAWDMTGAAYINASDFAVLGGTQTGSNSPQVTALLGAANNGSIVFSGLMTFNRVQIDNYQGTWAVSDAGAEQISFHDCIVIGGTPSSAVTPFEFVASGSTPSITSALVTTQSPIHSMTDVHWGGGEAALIYYGLNAVVFHYTAAGGIADIYFDDWTQANAASGNVVFMVDDANALAGTSLKNVGSNRLIQECNTSNTAIGVAQFSASSVEHVVFRGHAGCSAGINYRPFIFNTGLANSIIQWSPNDSGGWSGDYLVYAAAGQQLLGVSIQSNVPSANIVYPSGAINPSGGGAAFDYISVADDKITLGSPILRSPIGDGVCNVFSRVNDGTSTATNCQGSNASVSTAATIAILQNQGQMCIVTGHDSGLTNGFSDLVFVVAGGSGAASTLASGTWAGTPAARTYSFTSGALQLTMASGTYSVKTICYGGLTP
jgi:hypothetical protein